MKTIKVLFLASFFLIVGVAKSNAGENEIYNRAFTQIDEQVKALFKQFPFEAINGEDNSCLMVVTFTVNDDHRMSNIRVESENESLAQYVLSVLERSSITLDPILDGKNCRVPIRFVIEG
jgi:hypothetical protein